MKNNIRKVIILKVENVQELLNTLRKLGAAHTGDTLERTYWFDRDDRSLKKEGVFIRLRSGFLNTITIKENVDDNKYRSAKETQIEISDIEGIAYILNKIGLTYVRKMEKYRIEWLYRNCTMSIDELQFGVFLEIAGGNDEIETICSELGFDFKKRITKTYWFIHDENSIERDVIFPKNHKMRLL